MVLDVPVVLFIYKRPHLVEGLIKNLRAVRPKKIWLVSDGAKSDQTEEAKLCSEVRECAEALIDWPCHTKKIYSKSNLGLRERIVTGINEFFSWEEAGIFLEEDCYPDPTFFEFAQENLAHWKNYPQVAVISGSSFAKEKENKGGHSYYFSKYPHCWGWATWKRAWQYYDPSDMLLDTNLENLPVSMDGKTELRFWQSLLGKVKEGGVDSWACRWALSCWRRGMLTVTPYQNLVRNVGSGVSATHTSSEEDLVLVSQSGKMNFPLSHPLIPVPDSNQDVRTFRRHYLQGARLPFWPRLVRSFGRRMKKIVERK